MMISMPRTSKLLLLVSCPWLNLCKAENAATQLHLQGAASANGDSGAKPGGLVSAGDTP
jgi:hypothetical protein